MFCRGGRTYQDFDGFVIVLSIKAQESAQCEVEEMDMPNKPLCQVHSGFRGIRSKIAEGCFAACLVAIPWAVLAAVPGPAMPQVYVVPAPADSFVPDVVMDGKGVLHMVYARNKNAEYVRSEDNGATWTRPVVVNSEGTVEFRMGERGPKMTLGGDSTIHVVWGDFWAPGVKTYVRHARSRDLGKSFGPRATVSSMPGVDGMTVTADSVGHVLAFWHVNVPPQSDIPNATRLHMAISNDDGATFQHDELGSDRQSRHPCLFDVHDAGPRRRRWGRLPGIIGVSSYFGEKRTDTNNLRLTKLLRRSPSHQFQPSGSPASPSGSHGQRIVFRLRDDGLRGHRDDFPLI